MSGCKIRMRETARNKAHVFMCRSIFKTVVKGLNVSRVYVTHATEQTVMNVLLTLFR